MNEATLDRAIELKMDVTSPEQMSDCCGASVYNPQGSKDEGQCMDCKEPCGIVIAE